jgi:hypothetical protein
MTEQSCKTSNMLPYSVILSATAGDVEAINAVLKHYEKYIASMQQKKTCRKDSCRCLCTDIELSSRLESKLATGILEFAVE